MDGAEQWGGIFGKCQGSAFEFYDSANFQVILLLFAHLRGHTFYEVVKGRHFIIAMAITGYLRVKKWDCIKFEILYKNDFE